MPVAAFTGRRSLLALDTEAGRIEAELLAGRLRSVAAERPVARLLLDGPEEAVLALAREVAAEIPALPPAAALAEEGRALAQGTAVRLRRTGAPDLAAAETTEAAFEIAFGHLLEAMLGHAPLARPEAGPVGVHQMRVALRRLRSVLRLFQPVADGASLRGIDAALRDLARLLGPARDWDVFQAGLGAELPEAFPEPRMQALSRAAEAERLSGYAALRKHVEGPGFRTLAWHAVTALRLRPWRLEQEEPEAVALRAAPVRDFAAQVLDKRRKKLLEMGEDIEALDAEALHELRLEGKRLRYAAELFAPLWPGKAARRFLGRLSELQDGLGVANDTAVARALVNGLATREAGRAWAIGVAEGYAAARGGVARKEAHRLWDRLVDAETFWSRN